MSESLKNRLGFLVIVILLSISTSSCITVTGEDITKLRPGMREKKVFEIMGDPDGFKLRDGFTVYSFTNRLISDWGHDRADYHVIFKKGRLVEYGAGEVRVKEVEGVQTLFI